MVLSEVKKVSGGRYVCPACNTPFNVIDCKRLDEKMVRIAYRCPSCGTSSERAPTGDDVERYQRTTSKLAKMVEDGQLSYPQDMIPDGDRVRDDALYKKGYTHFYQLFTKRNLFANSMLKKAITSLDSDSDATKALLFVFSSSLSWSSKVRKDTGHGWEHLLLTSPPNWGGVAVQFYSELGRSVGQDLMQIRTPQSPTEFLLDSFSRGRSAWFTAYFAAKEG
jgi:hypothetical protein